MTSNNLSMLCVCVSKDVLNEIVAVLIAGDFNLSAEPITPGVKTYYQ